MEMILGVFVTTFYKMAEDNGWSRYPFPDLLDDENETYIVLVGQACEKATVINILLDDIYVPLNSAASCVCRELAHILPRPHLLKKSRFWINKKRVSKRRVLQIIEKAKGDLLLISDIINQPNDHTGNLPKQGLLRSISPLDRSGQQFEPVQSYSR